VVKEDQQAKDEGKEKEDKENCSQGDRRQKVRTISQKGRNTYRVSMP